ncbi:MAG: GSCFA domain-containing protein [Bacteroidia bacterium]
MKFRTDLRISPFSFNIEHSKPVLLLGSCFSSNIGLKLKKYRFKTTINPHGIVFNPHSLSQIICNAIDGEGINEQFIVDSGNEFKSLEYHSDLNGSSREELIQKIAVANVKLSMSIKHAHTVFLTLGSSWVYEFKSLNRIISNCQKQPQTQFNKKLLSVSEISDSLNRIIESIKKVNPNLNVVFTVSPIRHIKDGIIENQRSKSHLIAAVHNIVDQFECCNYFPSYELLIDDLRDYRFYEKDLIHPNDQSIEYVWEQFERGFFNEQTSEINRLIGKLNSALAHRIIGNDKNITQKFIVNSIKLCETLEQALSVSLAVEKEHFLNLNK